MTIQRPISIFIICQNEEQIIDKCLEQASKLANEIIVVDSGSTDATLEIAKKYTDKIYYQDWLGYSAQKNYALRLCSNEWVLSLDADEVLSDELIDEIKNLNLSEPGYQIARRFFIGEREINWGGFYPDYQLRLFKKDLGRFCSNPVHESIELYDTQSQSWSKNRSNCTKLNNALLHYSYQSLGQMQQAYNKYAALSKKKRNYIKAILSCIYSFFYRYIFRLGFLEGSLGIKLALVCSQYSFDKYKPLPMKS